jgi:hypothetical protein
MPFMGIFYYFYYMIIETSFGEAEILHMDESVVVYKLHTVFNVSGVKLGMPSTPFKVDRNIFDLWTKVKCRHLQK